MFRSKCLLALSLGYLQLLDCFAFPSVKKDPPPTPTLTLTPTNLTVSGANLTFKCEPPKVGGWIFAFYRNGLFIVRNTNGSLKLNDVQTDFSGNWTCAIQYSAMGDKQSNFSNTVSLTVVAPLPTPTLSVTPGNPVGEGADITMHCHGPANGTWEYTLYFMGGLYAKNTDGRDTIRDAQASASGNYTCTLAYVGVPGIQSDYSNTINMTVIGAPLHGDPVPDVVHISATPTSVLESFTKFLEVTCRVHVVNSTVTPKVMSLLVYKEDAAGSNIFSDVASLTWVEPGHMREMDTMNATVTGHLAGGGGGGDTFITLQWRYPSAAVIGRYRCEAHGVEGYEHHLWTATDHVLVGEAIPSIEMLIQKLKDMDNELDTLKTKPGLMLTNVNNAHASMFEKTSEFRNSSYSLSRPIRRNMFEADRQCRLQGGYLAEINDELELNFIATIFKPTIHDYDNTVLLGATDEASEGRWQFIHSEKTVTFSKWDIDQPNGGRDENCVFLSAITYKLSDAPCYYNNFIRFLCEAPVGL